MDHTSNPPGLPAQDTGLHCLLLVTRFYGLAVDGAQLRHQFGDSKPLTRRDLLRAARYVGLKAGTVTTKWPKLVELPLPAIAYCTDGRFVLLAKVDADKVLLHDPLQAQPTIVGKQQFEARWNGELLLVTKRAKLLPEDFVFGFSWFIPAIIKHRWLLGEVVLASFFVQLIALITPLFVQVVIDKVLVHKGFTTLHVMAGGMVGLALFEALLGGLRAYVFSHTTNRIDVGLGAQMFRHLLALPLAYFEARRVGDTVARVRELEQVRQFLTSNAVTVVLDLFFIVLFLE